MTRSLLASLFIAILPVPALAQSAVEDAFAVCSKPDRWIHEAVAELEAKGWGLLTTREVPETARLDMAIQVIDRAAREGWSDELSGSPERAESEVQAGARHLEEGLTARVRNGMPFAIPPSEFATMLAPGGGVMDLTFTPEYYNAHCLLRGLWKGSSAVVVGGERLMSGADSDRPEEHYARLDRPGFTGEARARFFDLEVMAETSPPAAGQAFTLTIEATRD